MIVVVGTTELQVLPPDAAMAVGGAPEIAAAAAAAGAAVELLAKVGEDGAGEELLIALGRAGIGHLAVLRDPGRPTGLAAPDPAEDEEAPVVASLVVEDDLTADEAVPTRAMRALPCLELDPADCTLGLRYLRDYRVVVAVQPLGEGCVEVIAEAASFAGARLVVVVAPGSLSPAVSDDAIVLGAPPRDPDGAFATVVGRLAAALDDGVDPAIALREATATGGWEPAAG